MNPSNSSSETVSGSPSASASPSDSSFLTMHFLILIGSLFLLGLLVVLIVHRKFIKIVFQTMPRDLTAAVRVLPFITRLQVYQWKNLTVHQVFDSIAAKYPNKVCFYYEDEEWTFRMVEEFSNRVGNYFLAKGLKKGDTVGLFMENRPEYVAIWLGLAKIGVIPALINFNLRLQPLEHSLEAAQCKALIYGNEVTAAVTEVNLSIPLYEFNNNNNSNKSGGISSAVSLKSELNQPQVSSAKPIPSEKINFNDKLLYIYTSGTTGLPKAAIIKHGRFMFIASSSHYVHATKTSDIFYTALPLYHSAGGILGIGQALLFGTSLVIRKKFSASNFWTDCIRYNVTVTQYIGELCRYLLAVPIKPEDKQHKIRTMVGNGLREEIWREFTGRFNVNIAELYGSTEGNCNLTNFDGRVGAVGFIPRLVSCLSPVVLIKVDPFTGEILRDAKSGLAIRCQPNEPGELIGIINTKRPLTDFEGYSDHNSKAKKMCYDIFKKGDKAFRSGDILLMDELGYFYFKDRIGDTYRWKGENVSTTEVEAVANKFINETTNSTATEVVVFGVQIPGTEGRAGMIAIVDPHHSIDINGLATEMTKQLPAYARPLFVRLLKGIDTTGTFKLKKIDLQKDGYNFALDDPIYFFTNGHFVKMDESLYTDIVTGNIKV